MSYYVRIRVWFRTHTVHNKFFLLNTPKTIPLEKMGEHPLAPSSHTQYPQVFESHKEKPQYLHVAIGAVAVIFVYSLLQNTLNGSALISLIIFNLLSVLLTFPLHGPLWCKILWLGLGNLVGFAWNLIQLSLITTIATTGLLHFMYLTIGPIIDFMWIASIWSLGLSALAATERQKREEKRREKN